MLSENEKMWIPLSAVLLAFSVAYGFQVKNSWDQKQLLQSQLTEFGKELPRIQLVNTKMLDLSRDLVDLSKSSAAARQIIREFNIRLDPKKDSNPS